MATAAQQRPSQPVLPRLDADGLLRYRGRWVAIPDTQIPAVALLVDRCRELVRRDELSAAYEEGGGHLGPSRIYVLVSRLRARLEPLGLQIRSIRGRGVVLDVPDPEPSPHRPDIREELCSNS